MEDNSKKILSIQTLNKRMSDGKSATMEKAGFVQAMAELMDQGLSVEEVVTDANLGIEAVMSMTYCVFVTFGIITMSCYN